MEGREAGTRGWRLGSGSWQRELNGTGTVEDPVPGLGEALSKKGRFSRAPWRSIVSVLSCA